jgi:hypothetical protein
MTVEMVKGIKTELLSEALADEAVEAICVKCGVVEFVIPLDGPIDDIFLANYHCDECDSVGEA